MRARDKISIGWCDRGEVDGAFAADMMRLMMSRGDRFGPLVRVQGSGLLSRIRNQVVAAFLDRTESEWLWMIDTDHRIPAAAVDRLIAAGSFGDRPVVAGLCFSVQNDGGVYPTPVPGIFRHDGDRYQPVRDFPRDSVIRVDAAGTGCLLVHRRALQAIRDQAPANARDWCWFQDGPTEAGRWLSEDLTFCARLTAAGIPIVADTGAVFPHRRTYWLGIEQYEEWEGAQHG